MKNLKSKRPADAPEGTIQFGGRLPWFSVSLTIWSDDVEPDDITELLGLEPDRSRRKGEKPARSQKSAMWSIEAKDESADQLDVGDAIGLLLDRVPAPAETWRTLMKHAKGRVFVGLAMDAPNRGFDIEPALMRRLSDAELRA